MTYAIIGFLYMTQQYTTMLQSKKHIKLRLKLLHIAQLTIITVQFI